MGDHRASIKIEMEFHGVKDSCDMWINYSGEGGEVDGVDYRVIEFFRSVYERGMIKYREMMSQSYKREHAAEIEAAEKRTLKELKDKYEPAEA